MNAIAFDTLKYANMTAFPSGKAVSRLPCKPVSHTVIRLPALGFAKLTPIYAGYIF